MTFRPRTRVVSLLIIVSLIAGHPDRAQAQQLPDTAFRPPISSPSFLPGKGPMVCVDHGHFNFHRIDGRYAAFASLLSRDGYRLRPLDMEFDLEALNGCTVLVVANALAERNAEFDWSLPTPSAFNPREIGVIEAWVEEGGSLFLIADHMPFAGAASELGAAFEVTFSNGFTMYEGVGEGEIIFRRSDGSLRTEGGATIQGLTEGVDSVLGGIGSAFLAPGMEPVLVWREGAVSKETEVAWEFPEGTSERPIGGWLQGAVGDWGRGRVAVFGEGSSFTAQLQGPARTPMGMNNALAGGNVPFLLNLMRWLVGVTP
jgi:hypothetical protein